MNLWSLTNEKVEELKKQKDDKQSEYNLLKDKTVEDIWKGELEELLEAYEKWYQDKLDDTDVIDFDVKKPKKQKKKNKKNKSNSIVV